MDETSAARIGISTIATYEPPWVFGNEGFGDTIPRKFVHHAGIESRPISLEDEVTMGLRVVRNLRREVGCDLNDCAALVFVSPSFVPLSAARRLLELINGFARHIGNVSSRSIPYALKKSWQRLHGLVACPTAAVGSHGITEVSQGCILLRSTPLHDRQRQVAA